MAQIKPRLIRPLIWVLLLCFGASSSYAQTVQEIARKAFAQNPPPKKRYGYFGRLEAIFYSKISEKDPDITVAL